MIKAPVDSVHALKLWHAFAKMRQQTTELDPAHNPFAMSMLPDVIGVRMAIDNELREVTGWWEQIGWREQPF